MVNIMKKKLSLIIMVMLCMLLCLCGCGANAPADQSSASGNGAAVSENAGDNNDDPEALTAYYITSGNTQDLRLDDNILTISADQDFEQAKISGADDGDYDWTDSDLTEISYEMDENCQWHQIYVGQPYTGDGEDISFDSLRADIEDQQGDEWTFGISLVVRNNKIIYVNEIFS